MDNPAVRACNLGCVGAKYLTPTVVFSTIESLNGSKNVGLSRVKMENVKLVVSDGPLRFM